MEGTAATREHEEESRSSTTYTTCGGRCDYDAAEGKEEDVGRRRRPPHHQHSDIVGDSAYDMPSLGSSIVKTPRPEESVDVLLDKKDGGEQQHHQQQQRKKQGNQEEDRVGSKGTSSASSAAAATLLHRHDESHNQRENASSGGLGGGGGSLAVKGEIVDNEQKKIPAATAASSNAGNGSVLSGPFSISPELLKIFCGSKFLTTKEVGKLLLLTSKSLTLATYPTSESLWMCLCQSEWGEEAAKTRVSSMNVGSEGCFRRLYPSPGRRPVQYAPSDYLITLDVYSHDQDKPALFTSTIRGDEVPEFFEKGYFEFLFPEPGITITLPKALESESEQGSSDSTKQREREIQSLLMGSRAHVHIMRLPDSRCHQVISGESHTGEHDSSFDDEFDSIYEYHVDCGGGGRNFTLYNKYGRHLLQEIYLSSNEKFSYVNFELTLFFALERSKRLDGAVKIKGFELSAEGGGPLCFFSSCLHGDLTFAHIFEALDMWT